MAAAAVETAAGITVDEVAAESAAGSAVIEAEIGVERGAGTGGRGTAEASRGRKLGR